MNKLIMTEQERRLNDKMKYSHLGAALLWCLRAHKTMKVYTQHLPIPLALSYHVHSFMLKLYTLLKYFA